MGVMMIWLCAWTWLAYSLADKTKNWGFNAE